MAVRRLEQGEVPRPRYMYVQWLGVCASCACDDESKKSENILVRTVRLSSVAVE